MVNENLFEGVSDPYLDLLNRDVWDLRFPRKPLLRHLLIRF